VDVALFPRLEAALAGRYTVERELGRGGMATVYLAHDLRHDRRVAVKVLRPDLAAVLGVGRFLREIAVAGRLVHPHILPLYDSGRVPAAAGGREAGRVEGELLYYTMPYVEGESLRERLAREGALPLAEALTIARQVADALAYAHAHNVIHRDIKPGNILLTGSEAFVADFGIARAVVAAAGDTLSDPGLVVGTPAYMSPEQASGEGHLDGRADVYALGCVLYEMLAGEPPHTGPTVQAILARHQYEQPRPLRTVRPDLPPGVERIVLKALAKVPADRFRGAAELSAALAAPASGRARLSRPRLAALGVLAAVAGWWAMRPPAPDPAGAGPGADPTDVAVLYFEDRGGDGALRPVANGLTEELIDALGAVPTLRVVSPNGVRPYLDARVPPDSIGRALRVGTLVAGTVGRSADSLRVTVRLIDAATGRQLDSRTVERPWGDLFALQDALAADVSRFLRERLGREVLVRRRREGTRSVEAWELAQRAESWRETAGSLGTGGDETGARRALDGADSLLARASALDPAWLDPVVLRGWGELDRIELALTGDPAPDSLGAWFRRAFAHADRAVALRAGDPAALELRGTLRFRRWLAEGRDSIELSAAEQDLRSAAVPANPREARAWATLSAVLQTAGRHAEANLAARRAWETDAFLAETPQVLFRLYYTALDLGRDAEAIRWCETGRQRFPERPSFVLCQLTIMLRPGLAKPDVGRAWRAVAELERLSPPEERAAYRARWQMAAAGVLARAGLAESAGAVIRRARSAAPDDPELDYHEATARMLLDDRDAVLRLLARDLRANPQFRSYIAADPTFRPLRDDPRFRALVGDGPAGNRR
jgi:TolB-like protein